MKSLRSFFAIAAALLIQSGCARVERALDIADFPRHRQELLEPFRGGDYRQSARLLYLGSEKPGPDQLLFLLDRALSLYHAGLLQESRQVFGRAAKLIEVRDPGSAAEVRGGNIANMRWRLYHGDEFEAVLYHVMISFLEAELGDIGSAVESMRAAERLLTDLNRDQRRSYTLAPLFTLWPSYLFAGEGSIVAAKAEFDRYLRAGSVANAAEVQARFAVAMKNQAAIAATAQTPAGEAHLLKAYRELRDYGRGVVVVFNGFAPRKQPHPEHGDLVELREPYTKYEIAEVYVDGEYVGDTQPMLSITELASTNMAERKRQRDVDRASGFVEREARLQKLAESNPGHRAHRVSERTYKLEADLRQWAGLPADIQLLSLPLPKGLSEISIRMRTQAGRRGPFRSLGRIVVSESQRFWVRSYRTTLE